MKQWAFRLTTDKKVWIVNDDDFEEFQRMNKDNIKSITEVKTNEY